MTVTHKFAHCAQVVETFQIIRRGLVPDVGQRGRHVHIATGTSQDGGLVIREMTAKSGHLAKVAEEVVGCAPMLQALITRISTFRALDMGALQRFVHEVDEALDALTDEATVLRHFEWPVQKHDVLREAAGLYRELINKKHTLEHWERGGPTREDARGGIQKYIVSGAACGRWVQRTVRAVLWCRVDEQIHSPLSSDDCAACGAPLNCTKSGCSLLTACRISFKKGCSFSSRRRSQRKHGSDATACRGTVISSRT